MVDGCCVWWVYIYFESVINTNLKNLLTEFAKISTSLRYMYKDILYFVGSKVHLLIFSHTPNLGQSI